MTGTFGAHIPEVQLPHSVFRDAMELAGLQLGEVYYEPGSGHGRGLVIAAKEFGAKAVGVEILADANATALAAARKADVSIEVQAADLRHRDAGEADVVLLHLGPAFHDVLADQLASQLSPTARVVACGWSVPGWIELQSCESGDTPLFLYQPAHPQHQIEVVQWGDGYAVVTTSVNLAAIEAGDGTRLATFPARPRRGQRFVAELPSVYPKNMELVPRPESLR